VNLYGLKYLYPEYESTMPFVDIIRPAIDIVPVPNQEIHEMDDGNIEVIRYNPEINYQVTADFPKIRDISKFEALLEFYFNADQSDRGAKTFIWQFPESSKNYTANLESLIKGKLKENYVLIDPVTIKLIGYF